MTMMTLTLNPAVDKKLYIKKAALGETNKCRLLRTDLSGKGINVAKAVSALGYNAAAAGFMGKKDYPAYAAYLDSYGIAYDFVLVNGDVRTNIKLTEENGRETEINEDGFTVTGGDITALFNKLAVYYKKNNILCISGSLPGGAPETVYRDIINDAKQTGVRVILDTSGDALKYGVSALPYAVKPNIRELEEYCGYELKTPDDIKKAALMLGVPVVAVTCGDKGAFFITKDNFLHANITEKIPVKGTIGAGDAFTAALAVSVMNNSPPGDTLKLCIASAAASCMQQGTVPGSIQDINRLKNTVTVQDFA